MYHETEEHRDIYQTEEHTDLYCETEEYHSYEMEDRVICIMMQNTVMYITRLKNTMMYTMREKHSNVYHETEEHNLVVRNINVQSLCVLAWFSDTHTSKGNLLKFKFY